MAESDYIDDTLGPGDARLRDSKVHVWAIVGYAHAVGGNVGRVAADYDLPKEAVSAALSYYAEHRDAIDERLATVVA